MLKQSDLDVNQKAKIEIAEYSSKYLSQLLNMVTNNTGIDTGNIKLNILAMDLKSDLSELFKVFEYQAWEKELMEAKSRLNDVALNLFEKVD